MDLKSFWKSSRSTIVSGLIALVVIVGLFVLFNALPATQPQKTEEEQKQEEQKQADEKKEQEKEDQSKDGKGEKAELPTKYTVKHGDDLWKISTRLYGTGYNWTALARANKLAKPDVIHSGNVLTVPKVEARAHTYKVVRGDSLWSISERLYGSGFSWTKIRDANQGKIGKLPNGRPLITPGQVLAVP